MESDATIQVLMNTNSAPTVNILKTEYAPNYKVMNTDSILSILNIFIFRVSPNRVL